MGREPRSGPPDEPSRCSLCNKKQGDVRKLIAGPRVFICEECVSVCVDIIKDDAVAEAARSNPDAHAEAQAHLMAEAQNLENRGPLADWDVPPWHVRCPLCERVVRTDDALAIEGRGVLCRGCVVAVQATPLYRSDS